MEENKEVVEETTQETTQPQIDESKFESAGDDSVYKVDLNKPIVYEEPTKTEEDTTDTAGVVGSDEDSGSTEEQEEVQSETEVQETETPVLE